MQRQANESFSQYRIRRAAANLATKSINAATRRGGTTNGREQLRRDGNPKGEYGANIIRAIARRNATPARLATHLAHVAHIADRKARRAAQPQNDNTVRLAA